MKKYWFIFIVIIIAVTGCNKPEKVSSPENTYSIKYNDAYYNIFLPYKKGVGNNYILNSNVVDFDVESIEKNLIQISTSTFSVDKYYYQEGQYLTKQELIDLLSNDNLNNIEKRTIDGKTVKPKVIAGIYEKNFLNKSGDIKGLSIGIILNKYHAYDSNNNYVTMDENEVIEIGQDAGKKVIEYLRKNKKLNNIPILVALYLESSPESNIGGNYLYYGVTENNEIKYNSINQKEYYMNTQTVKQTDPTNYNNFKKFVDAIRTYDNSIYVSGLGHFDSDTLSQIEISITKNYYTYGELLYINQLLSDTSIKYFKDVKVVIEVKAVNDIKSYIVKENGETSTDIFIY